MSSSLPEFLRFCLILGVKFGAHPAGEVLSITGTANQIIASSATGNVILSAPQNLNITANFQVATLGVGAAHNASAAVTITNAPPFGLYITGLSTTQFGNGNFSFFINNTIQPVATLVTASAIIITPIFDTTNASIHQAFGIYSAPTTSITNSLTSLYAGYFGAVSGAATVNRALHADDFEAGTAGNFVVDGQSVMTNTAQPMLYAYRNAAYNNITGDGVLVSQFIFDTVVFDVGSNYNASTGSYLISETGVYQVFVSISYSGITTDNTSGFLEIVAGLQHIRVLAQNPGAIQDVNGQASINTSFLVTLNSGDLITSNLIIAGSATKNINALVGANDGSNPSLCFLTISKLA